MMANTYVIGEAVTLTATFLSTATGEPIDPTTTTISIRDPVGNITTPTPTRQSAGIYTCVWTPTTPGLWRWKAQGAGAVTAISSPQQGSLEVVNPSF
jgi:hypothetical protein